MKNIFVDHLEAGMAHCEAESGEVIMLEISQLPPNTKEQDWLTLENGKYVLNKELTEKNRHKNLGLYKKLKNKD